MDNRNQVTLDGTHYVMTCEVCNLDIASFDERTTQRKFGEHQKAHDAAG